MSTSTQTALVESYLEMWNEADPGARRRLIERVMTPDASYVDPMAEVSGAEAIGELISAVQGHFPGHRFELHTAPDAHHDSLRFRWALVADGGEPVAIGLDVAELAADGRMRSVTGFLDPVS
jgi:hypothetical protein